MRIVLALLLVSVGCGGTEVEEETSEQASSSDPERERAIEVARTLGVSEGYPAADYELQGAERVTDGPEAGHWLVSFEHVPPAPPGGHFGVYVDPATWQGRVMHGE